MLSELTYFLGSYSQPTYLVTFQRVWRDVLREYEFYYEDRPHTPDYLKFNVLGENSLLIIAFSLALSKVRQSQPFLFSFTVY